MNTTGLVQVTAVPVPGQRPAAKSLSLQEAKVRACLAAHAAPWQEWSAEDRPPASASPDSRGLGSVTGAWGAGKVAGAWDGNDGVLSRRSGLGAIACASAMLQTFRAGRPGPWVSAFGARSLGGCSAKGHSPSPTKHVALERSDADRGMTACRSRFRQLLASTRLEPAGETATLMPEWSAFHRPDDGTPETDSGAEAPLSL